MATNTPFQTQTRTQLKKVEIMLLKAHLAAVERSEEYERKEREEDEEKGG